MRFKRLAPVLAGLLASIGGQAMAAQAIAPGAHYVAMGSSFAAGPGVATRAAGELPVACQRSAESYPRQLARHRGLTLTDRSCGGAVAPHILVGGQMGQPAQLEGLRPETRLVTVTIGGNDVRYMADLGQWSCRNAPDVRPQDQRGQPCPAGGPLDAEAAFATLDTNLRAIAAEVKRRSPQARLIFVDYITILPPVGTSCAKLPLTPAQMDEMRARVARLAAMTAQVAKETGVEVLKASDLTLGHDVCAAEPWAEGQAYRQNTTDFGPAAFHPKQPAMTAIAKGLDAMLR